MAECIAVVVKNTKALGTDPFRFFRMLSIHTCTCLPNDARLGAMEALVH